MSLPWLSHVQLSPTSSLTACLCIAVTEPILAGHFPSSPLVPGVLLIEAVRCAYSAATGHAVDVQAVDDVRFFQPLPPAVVAELSATAVAGDAEVRIDGEWSMPTGRIASFRLRLVRSAERRGVAR